MNIKFKKLNDNAVMPIRQHESDAAYDLIVPEDTTIYPGGNIIKLNFAMQLPLGYGGYIKGRSGMDAKGIPDIYDIRHESAKVISGLVDAGYRDCVGVIVYNDGPREFKVKAGLRIAQMMILKCYTPDFVEVDSLDESDRSGGFGSTGTR